MRFVKLGVILAITALKRGQTGLAAGTGLIQRIS